MSGSSNGEQKGSRTRMSNGAVRPMYNDDAFNSDLDSPVEEQNDVVMRVGKDFQAKVPDCCPDMYDTKHEALLVWQPCVQKITNAQVDDFCTVAHEKHKYSEEQALGMLFWHKHDVDKALVELANFAPFPDEWSSDDKLLFTQAFQNHGKSFHRIREMLPDKSIANLVKYYYGWKKVRSRPSVMDRQAKQAPISDMLSDLSDESDSNSSDKSEVGGAGPACDNCGATSNSLTEQSQHGKLCQVCHSYTRRTGVPRPFSLFRRNIIKNKDSPLMPQRFNPTKNRKRPPKGIYMDEVDLKLMAVSSEEQRQAIFNKITSELALLKSQVQNNKQHICLLKGSVQESIDEYTTSDALISRPTSRWTQDELLMGVQGVRNFGKDFQTIAQLIGTKNTTQVRAFFSAYKKKYNLDGALAEYEATQKSKDQKPIDLTDDDDVDHLMPLTPPPLIKNPSSPGRSPSTHKGRTLSLAGKGRASPKPKSIGAQVAYSSKAGFSKN